MSKLNNIFSFQRNNNPEEQLETWCDQTWPGLYRYVYARVQNREEAEDITQEAYVRTLAKGPFSELPSQAYLRMVALNIIRDRWRQKKSRGDQVVLQEVLLSSDEDVSQILDRTVVENLLKGLSEEHRTVLQLRIVEGYSRAETAFKMKKSEDAVRELQYRAVQKLRSLLLAHVKEGDER